MKFGGKREFVFKSTKGDLENTVIKLASHNSVGIHKITIRKTNDNTLQKDLTVRLKGTVFQVNC